MLLSLLLSCQISYSQPVSLTPNDVDPLVTFQRPNEMGRVRIAAVGDITIPEAIKADALRLNERVEDGLSSNNGGFDPIFTELRPLLQSAHITFGNLDTPVAPDHHLRSNVRLLNAPPLLLSSLAKSGFDLLSVVNQHSFDQGRAGLRETIERIERNKIVPIGAGRNCVDAKRPHHIEVNNINVAFIAASVHFNRFIDSGVKNTCAFKVKTADDIQPFIQNAREEGADIVVISMHWGQMYKPKPKASTQKLATDIIEAGADIILGHAPNVLQPIEVYPASDGRTGVIAYSLGSLLTSEGQNYLAFVQNNSKGNTRDSGILSLDIVKRNYGEDGVRTDINNVNFTPVWMTHNPQGDQLPAFFPRLIDDQILRTQEEIDLLEDSSKRLYKKNELEFLFLRREHIAKTVGEEWITPLVE